MATELLDLATMRKETDKIDRASVEQKNKMVRDRKLTKGINWSKVRCVLVCENCRAPRCVYSRHAIGNAKGPTKKKHGNSSAIC